MNKKHIIAGSGGFVYSDRPKVFAYKVTRNQDSSISEEKIEPELLVL